MSRANASLNRLFGNDAAAETFLENRFGAYRAEQYAGADAAWFFDQRNWPARLVGKVGAAGLERTPADMQARASLLRGVAGGDASEGKIVAQRPDPARDGNYKSRQRGRPNPAFA